MGEIVVNSTVVTRFKFSRFDKFEARNRPHLHILVRCASFVINSKQTNFVSNISYICDKQSKST